MAPACFSYTSFCYLSQIKDSKLEPVIDFPLSTGIYSLENPIKQRAEWTLDVKEPKLPVKAVFFDDGYKRGQRLGKNYKRAVPYDAGFTNAIYSVEAFTNMNGLRLPSVAVLNVFSPKDKTWSPNALGKTRSELLLHSRYLITLTNASAHCSISLFRPIIDDECIVTDVRFVDQTGLLSYFSNSEWPTESSIRGSEGFKKEQRAYALYKQLQIKTGQISNLGRLLIISIMAFPILYYFYRGRENQLQENPGEQNLAQQKD
jgi:hypothetical protein